MSTILTTISEISAFFCILVFADSKLSTTPSHEVLPSNTELTGSISSQVHAGITDVY